MEKFHDYLYGNTFIVRIDNNPLTYVTTSAKLDATGHCWLAASATYNFDLIYCSGKKNVDEDALSGKSHKEELVIKNDTIKAISQSLFVEGCNAPRIKSFLNGIEGINDACNLGHQAQNVEPCLSKEDFRILELGRNLTEKKRRKGSFTTIEILGPPLFHSRYHL